MNQTEDYNLEERLSESSEKLFHQVKVEGTFLRQRLIHQNDILIFYIKVIKDTYMLQANTCKESNKSA